MRAHIGLLGLVVGLIAAAPQQRAAGVDFSRPVYHKDGTNGLAKWLPSDNFPPDQAPWGNRTSTNTDPYFGMPDTGVTRHYTLEASRGLITADGYKKQALLVNKQFPGPMIEANWGDWIEVDVINSIHAPGEGFAIHWHGLQQRDTPWMDGVPGVTQCGIAPGSNLTYRFRADRYGSSWYHSHYSSQYIDGVTGPMIIHGPDHVDYDVDLGPVMLSDLRHPKYETINHEVMDVTLWDIINLPKLFNLLPYGYSNMINGASSSKGCGWLERWRNQCTGDDWQTNIPSYRFEKGRKYKMRLMNVGGDATQHFSIDGHNLTVVSTDFTQIEPWETNRVTLGVGQRADVIVIANGDSTGSYWMRTNVAWCSLSLSYSSQGIIYYDNADISRKPTTKANPDHSFFCAGDPLKDTKPIYKMNATAEPAVTMNFTTFYTINRTSHLTVTMDFPYTYRGNYSTPLLDLVSRRRPISRWKQLYDLGTNATIRVVLNNPTVAQNAHAFHFHGHDMQVLAEGPGWWDGKTVDLENPVRRDTQIVLPDGHMVFQYKNDNPGIWPMHCHIPWHVADGLVVNLMEDSEGLKKLKGMSEFMDQTCVDWRKWAATQDLQDQN